MKWITQSSRYGAREHIVELTPEENMLSDEQLINLADSYGEKKDTGFHFGGTVERLKGSSAKITVYTD